MVWVFVYNDDTERITKTAPKRIGDKIPSSVFKDNWDYPSNSIILPKGTIKKLTGIEITKNDNAIKLDDEYFM